jgi:tRNA nucleotidyltransferase/poly(A) polymerase
MTEQKLYTLQITEKQVRALKEATDLLMRALRFAITKNMYLHYYTWDNINTDFAAKMLMKVSIERIREELEKMFAANTPKTIELLNELNSITQRSIFRDGLRLMPTLKQ